MEEYEPIKVLGEGSFGKVYLMKHGKTRDLVCTKVIKLKNIPPKEQEACRNEVDLLRRMCHPNIVGYTNSFLYKNCLCIIMEYCDAGDLGDRVNEAKGSLLPESKVMTWFVQTALGLHFMHMNRVLHRDIKTQNVFILSSGRVVLGDLGISKLLGGTRDFASTCIGTPYYMSPEIFKNHPYNNKSDVWALGCLLYELLTLKHAFDAQSLNGLAGKIIKGKFPSVSSQYSKNLRALVNDMLATNPKKRPDIEQILRKSFVQVRVKEFVTDLNASALHRQDKAMNALSDQLIDLQMEDAVPMELLVVDEGADGEDGPNAPSPSESDAAKAAAAAASKGSSRSELKAQKHQLELEEEKRIAAEMALNRLRKKAAERRRRASLSRSNSPVGDAGVGRIGGVSSPRSPGSPDEGEDPSSPSRSRRPSLFQRLGSLATGPMGGRRKSLSTPGSPSGTHDSPRSPSTARGGRGSGGGVTNDVDRAMAMAVEAAEEDEGRRKSVKGPTGAVAPSLARPKETTDYVSNPSPRRRPKSATRASGGSDDSVSVSARRGEGASEQPSHSSAEAGRPTRRSLGENNSPRGDCEKDGTSASRLSPDLPKLQLGVNAQAAPALRSGRNPSADDDDGGTARSARNTVFEEEEESDLFQVLKQQTKAHDREGEDQDIHKREEELRAKLREAEQRCHDLQENMRKVRSDRRGSAIQPPPAPADPAALEAMGLAPIDVGVNPVTAGDSVGGAAARARRGSYSRASSNADSDIASDFEDEPVPYCQSNMEELQDAPISVGNIVERVQFLKNKCIEGLGEAKFEKALDLLIRMQEGDCKVHVDGIEYDGNEDNDVERVLVKVIGRHKLQYWNLMDQLLLMS